MEQTKAGPWAKCAFFISVALLILVSLLNWGVVTGWGNTKITRLTLVGDNGMQYSALLYVPKNATNDTPAPAVLAFHGNSGNARNHESWAVEYTRRGYVFMAIDYLGAGDGEYNHSLPLERTAEVFTQYLLSQPFVDAERVMSTGHSMGGGTAYTIAKMFNTAGLISSDGRWWVNGEEGSIYTGNYAVISGGADDKCPPEKMRGLVLESFQSNGSDMDELIPDKVYGSFEEGNVRYYTEIPGQVHEGAFVDSGHIQAHLDFTMKCIEAPNYLEPDDQIWQLKDFAGLAGMIVLVATMIFFALMVIEAVPFFASIVQPLPRNIGLRGVGLAISVAAGLVFPLLCLYTGTFGLIEVLGGTGSSVPANIPLFPLHFSGISMALVVGISLLGSITLILFLLTDGKRQKATLRDLGLTSEGKAGMDWTLPGKALLLAVITAAVGWTYLAIQGAVLGTDFYCQFFGYKPIPAIKFPSYLGYIVVWMLCFIIAAIGMNVERRLPSTGKERLDTLIAMVVNVVLAAGTVTAVVIIQNAMQVANGGTATALGSWATDITRLWGMPVGMSIGAAGNTYLYRKTGNVWLGAFLMGIICALGCVLYGQLRYGVVPH